MAFYTYLDLIKKNTWNFTKYRSVNIIVRQSNVYENVFHGFKIRIGPTNLIGPTVDRRPFRSVPLFWVEHPSNRSWTA